MKGLYDYSNNKVHFAGYFIKLLIREWPFGYFLYEKKFYTDSIEDSIYRKFSI